MCLSNFEFRVSGYNTSVRRFANEVVGPRVREMDENESMDPAVIKGLFEQGVSDEDTI
jgi:short/branched chain acyl-CoA dehydrogenase